MTFANPLTGKSTLPVRVSTDDWKTVKAFRASIQVPLAKFFYPVRGLIELDDGRLLMTMYGRRHGDRIREDSPVGCELRTPWIKTRVIAVQSKDRGKSWQYLSTVSYNPQLGFEGQNESDLIRLPSGLLAVCMRNREQGYLAWQFVKDNWDKINEVFPSNSIVRMLSGITSLSKGDQADDVIAFFEDHEGPQGQLTLQQTLEKLRVNVALRERESERFAESLVR